MRTTSATGSGAGAFRSAGDSLADHIRRHSTGSLIDQLEIATAVARVVARWHAKDSFHGELSTSVVIHRQEWTVLPAGSKNEAHRGQDLRDFGLLLFELLTAQRSAAPLDLEPLHKMGLPNRLVDFVGRCAGFEDPPKSMDEVLSELESIRRQLLGERPSRRSLWLALAFSVAAAAAIAAAVCLS